MENLNRFKGKTVVIAGASRGIGLGLAKRFAEEGANLLISANEERIFDAVKALSAITDNVKGCICDVTVKKSVEAMFETALNEFNNVDISIHNAGVITIAKIEDLDEKQWDTVMTVNTKGVYLCCQAVIKIMKEQGHGKIINTASGQARDGFIYTPHYAASKMGVVGITQSLAKELAQFGITVNAICPGIIESDMWVYNDSEWGKLLGNYQKGELMKEWIENIPMHRAGKPEDVAGLVSFLASEDADYITGQTINVDGGLIMS